MLSICTSRIFCCLVQSQKGDLRYPNTVDRIFNNVLSNISIVQRETPLIISDKIEKVSQIVSEIVRVVSLSTIKIMEIT